MLGTLLTPRQLAEISSSDVSWLGKRAVCLYQWAVSEERSRNEDQKSKTARRKIVRMEPRYPAAPRNNTLDRGTLGSEV